MKKIGLGILGCIILIGLLVLLYIKQTTVDTCTKGCLPNNMENKTDDLQGVKSICEDNGGIIQPYDDEGGNFSLCLFDDGSFCESWELYRGECGKGDKQFEDFLEAMSGSEGITAGEEQNESFYDGMRIKCIESGYNWVQGDCMSGENIIEIIDSDPYVDDYFDGFTGNIINGKVDENLLTNKPNHIYFDITGDNTLYYIDEFGLSFSLGKEWKGGKIENAYEGKYLASVWIRNEGLNTIGIFIIDNTTYQRVKDSLSSDGDEYIGNNNKYTFQRRIVENGEKLGEYKLHLYDVEEQETIEEVGNINSAFSEFEGYIKECENQITNSRIPDIDGNITNISYLRLNKMNVGNAYKITGTLTYDDNGKTNKKEINCALTLGDYSVFGNTTMYNAFGSITTKSEEEQKCIKSLEKYPIEQMKGDRNTVIDVTCFPKDYFGPGFITGYVYTTKYSDLGLRITTPAGWRMMEPDGIFLTKSDKPIFVRKGNRISYFHPTVGEEMEYIEVYEKSKNESLEDIIKNKHLNKGCKVGKDIINYYHQNRVVAPYPGIEIFEPIGMSGGGWEGCIADNESQIDNGRIPRFFESPDKSKYYKLSMMDGCAPGPCSIFGKIELL